MGKKENNWYLKLVVKGLLTLLIIIAIVLVLAGRINYWQGWVFGGISFLSALIQSIAFVNKTELAKERVKPGPGMIWWDKIFWVFYGTFSLATFVISPIDTGRFGWSAPLPVTVYVIAYLIYILSSAIGLWSMRENKFFSSVVRIQTDRGQVVVESGPYEFVRHPGYVGGILLFISSPLMLGSVIGLIPGCFSVILLIVRTYLEDKTLQKELPGYMEYIKKVKYRLIPGIW